MPVRLTVLASGSSGNATFVDANDFGLLLDIGLGPRELAARMAQVGVSWDNVRAVLLTHTHTDHWNERTLAHLRRRQIPLYCHGNHARRLAANCSAFSELRTARLVRLYQTGKPFDLAAGVHCRPLPLRHDGGATFGFRLEGAASLFEHRWAIGYVADLGSWDGDLAGTLTDLDLLAVEFNHDLDLEYCSGRTARLISRVVGDDGHLSNEQAAALLKTVLQRSTPGRLRHVVQLHLSRECNSPSLAATAATAVLNGLGKEIVLDTASQDRPSRTFTIAAAQTDES